MEKFILLGPGRCGSEMIGKSLQQHPDIIFFGEVFNRYSPALDKTLFEMDLNYDLMDEESHRKICKKKVCISAHKKYDGFKLLFGHIHNDVEEYLNETKVVLLLRNPFKLILSSCVATMTNKWQSDKPFVGTIYLDPKDIENRIEYQLSLVSKYKKYSDLTIRYEDDFQSNYDKVCNLVNVSVFTPKILTHIRITRPLSEVIENYEEVKHLDKQYDF